MIREQLEVGADQQQSLMTTDKVDQDNQLIAQTEKWVARDEHRLTVDREQLQREAISNYVDFGYSSDATTMFQSQAVTLIKKEYQDVAFGDTAVAIDQMNTESNVVEAERSSLRHQEAVDQGLQQQAAELLDQAQNAQGQLQNQQSQVNSQLAAAIAQQQAAAAAQAAAARGARAGRRRRATGRDRKPGSRKQRGTGRSWPQWLLVLCGPGRVDRQLRCHLSRWHLHGRLPVRASRPGTRRPRLPGCPPWSASLPTRPPRPIRTRWPLRSSMPTVSSPGTTPAGRKPRSRLLDARLLLPMAPRPSPGHAARSTCGAITHREGRMGQDQSPDPHGLWRSLVHALDWGSRGPGFKSRQPDHEDQLRNVYGERL